MGEEMHGNITQSHHKIHLAGFKIHSAMTILKVLFVHFHCKCACQVNILAQLYITNTAVQCTSTLNWSVKNANNFPFYIYNCRRTCFNQLHMKMHLLYLKFGVNDAQESTKTLCILDTMLSIWEILRSDQLNMDVKMYYSCQTPPKTSAAWLSVMQVQRRIKDLRLSCMEQNTAI